MTMSSLAQEEYELMKDSKYRVYVSAVDKVLKNFEYTSEWADLISALGKLNKVLINHTKFPVIPRRITISKRLAQCMHPALPSGVHLKALETYDAIFKCMGTNRLAHELFIYSAGLFPLLGHAAMNVRLALLTVYETHFVPLGERLRPALSGFLSGVLPGLEPGSDHYDNTNGLLEKVCDGVGAIHFYSCLWEILSCNSATRFPAISFVLDHFNRKLNMSDQLHLIGKDSNVMVTGLCACMRDHSVLVQRSALELLLVGIPLHLPLLNQEDMVQLIVAGLSTLLRRDMSLNRRLYSWLLGSEINFAEMANSPEHKPNLTDAEETMNPYFEIYSRDLLVQAIRVTLSESSKEKHPDLKPYRLLMSLLDKSEIGPVILDDILLDLFRTLYNSCKDRRAEKCCEEIMKSSNMLLSSLEPFYIWDYARGLFAKCCESKSVVRCNGVDQNFLNINTDILELCVLIEYLLDVLPLETYVDTISEHLPKLFVKLVELLIRHLDDLTVEEIASSISLCTKIVSRVQVMVLSTTPVDLDNVSSRLSVSMHDINADVIPVKEKDYGLEKSKSDSKLNNSLDSSIEVAETPKKNSKKLFRKKKSSKMVKSLDSLNTTTSSDDVPEEKLNRVELQITKNVYQNQDTTKPLEKQTLLEKCIRVYEDFFVHFIAQRVLNFTNKTQRIKVNELFEILLTKNVKNHYDTESSVKILENILSNSINITSTTHNVENNMAPILTNIKFNDTTNNDIKLIETIKLSCRLLVELSSFPTYSPVENIPNNIFNYEHNKDQKLPDWLKVLTLCACLFKTEPEVQLSAISTLLDLTTLLRTQCESREASIGVTAVVVIPLMRKWHVGFLEKNTQVFQILAYTLWGHLSPHPTNLDSHNSPSTHSRLVLSASLLHQLHDCLPTGSPVAERTIGEAMGADRPLGVRLDSFQRFATLWHLGRSSSGVASNSGAGRPMRTFDKALLKMLDNLQLPESSSLKLYSASWVTQSLLRGDLHRLLDPILFILLDPLTSRMSILHVSIQHSNTRLTNKLDNEYDQTETTNTTSNANSKVYAISSVDGNVIYHVSDDQKFTPKSAAKSFTKKIINPLLKNHKFYSLKEKNVKKNVIGKHYTVNDVPENGLAVSPQQICLFVNPFTNNDNCNENTLDVSMQSDVTDISVSDSKIEKKLNDQTSSESTSYADEYYDSYADTEMVRSKSISGSSSSNSEVMASTHSKSVEDVSEKSSLKSNLRLSGILNPGSISDGLIEQLEQSMNEIKDGDILEAPVPAEEYFETEPKKYTKSKKKEHKCYDNGYLAKGVHQLHSHMLLYCEVYDSNRTIYALQTLRNEILTNPRIFLCSAATTGISNVPKGAHLLTLLARHKKSIYGHSFYGPIANTEYIYSYRNCMYLEILITVSLHFARSYYPNLGNIKLTPEELSGNQKVQLASAELLMLICTELINIVKDSGKGFASYIGDLLSKCKVHKVILHCVISSVYYMKLLNDNEEDITFTEEIMSFNDPNFEDDETKSKISNHIESFQVQLLHLLQSLIILEYQVNVHKTDDGSIHIPPSTNDRDSPTCTVKMHALKYNPSRPITQQPIFLASILLALQMDTIRHLHQHWTSLLTSSLPYITSNFKHIVISVIHQLCSNIEKISEYYDKDINNTKYEDNTKPNSKTATNLSVNLNTKNILINDSNINTKHEDNTTKTNSINGSITKNLANSKIDDMKTNSKHTKSISTTNDSNTNTNTNSKPTVNSNLPPDYTVTQLEALTVLCHYCLLDSNQQTSHVFNQNFGHGGNFGGNSTQNPGQIFNNLIHVFMPTPLNGQEVQKGSQWEIYMAARQVVLSHMPRIMAAVSSLWQHCTQPSATNNPNDTSASHHWQYQTMNFVQGGNQGLVKHQLLELLSPISLHHGVNFLAAVAVAWLERKDFGGGKRTVLPTANRNQLVLVYLISEIRVMPMDILVQTVHQVVKQPPLIHGAKQDLTLDVGILELFYWYMQSASNVQLADIWPSLLGLLRDGLTLSAPAQFLMIAILNEYVQKCPQFEDKRDQRDLHDITSKLIDSVSQIAGCCLQQTTWLRRNLAVKEEIDLISNENENGLEEGKTQQQSNSTGKTSQMQSVQAQLVLAELLATLLDVVYGSQEKVVTILTTLMYNITPYLKNHSQYNVPAFTACSNLLSSLSGYQYTRKAWRKDVFDLLLDSGLFQMEKNCLKYWRTIIDNLMTHDNTTFRDFMNRVSMTQSGSLSLFSSREQEYEQRALLLRRLAFVIFCSETDQYYKYMPEIQEQMTSSLRLPQVVPSVQAGVFLCFRVILLRVTSQHVTSLWPTIISELVQVLLQIEQELVTNTEEFSSHIKLLSALDNSWVCNSSNGLQAHGNPHWLQLQLAAAKLLDQVLVLPAKELPQFQMYRWAFVSDIDLSYLDMEDDVTSVQTNSSGTNSLFVPHVYRLARLMDVCYKNSHVETRKSKPGELLLTMQSIKSLQDLHFFFKTLSHSWHAHGVPDDTVNNKNFVSQTTEQLEAVLENDFIEKLPE